MVIWKYILNLKDKNIGKKNLCLMINHKKKIKIGNSVISTSNSVSYLIHTYTKSLYILPQKLVIISF